MHIDFPPLSGLFAPARTPPAQALVLLIHGYGANAQDLFPLAEPLQAHLPHLAVFAPQAPEAFPLDPSAVARQWFALDPESPITPSYLRKISSAARSAAQPLAQSFAQARSTLGIAAKNTALLGFSQGGMLALELGLNHEPAPAAVISFSGALLNPSELRPLTAHEPAPQVLLTHGLKDPRVPPIAIDFAQVALEKHGISVTAMRKPHGEHDIQQDDMNAAISLLVQTLPPQP